MRTFYVVATFLLLAFLPQSSEGGDTVMGDSQPKIAFDSVNNEYLLVYLHMHKTFDIIYNHDVIHYRIRAQKLDVHGNPTGSAWNVDNSLDDTTYRGEPDVYCPDVLGYCLVVWEDERDQNRTIYGAYVSNEPNIWVTGDFQISPGNAPQEHPAVAFGNDTYIVSWDHWLNNKRQLSLNVFTQGNCTPKALIIDDDVKYLGGLSDIEYDPDSQEFVLVFQKYTDLNHRDIIAYVRPASTDITLLAYHPITDQPGDQQSPTLAYNPENKEMLIAYRDGSAIRLQRFGHLPATPERIGPSFGLQNDAEGSLPSLAWSDARKEYLLVFQQAITAPSIIYKNLGVRISPEGAVSPASLLNEGFDTAVAGGAQGQWLIGNTRYISDNKTVVQTNLWPVTPYPALYYLLLN